MVTGSPGTVSVTNNVFRRGGDFDYTSGQTATGNSYTDCGQITAGGANLSDSTISEYEGTADTAVLVWNVNTDPDGYLDDMSFTKGTAATHAIELGTSSPTEVTLRGWTISGYNASNGENDSVIYVARTSGTVTINIVGGSGNFSYKSAGATVNVVVDPVSFTVSVRDLISGFSVRGRVFAEVSSGDNFDCLAPVSIVRSGEVAYVSHTAHSVSSGEYVHIRGTDQPEYKGARHVIYTGPNSYHFVVSGSPATPATGTPNATQILINGETDVDGDITDTRSYSVADQPFSGIVRKGTLSPHYKSQPITGTVDKDAGLSLVVQLASDE